MEDYFNPADILAALEETFRPLGLEKGITLHTSLPQDLPEQLFGDEMRIRQVLFNLVGNAMKFSDKGDVRVGVSLLPSSDPLTARLLFTVEDHGPGIDAEELDILFKPFTQGDATFTRKHQGAGLGLAICKRLTEVLGATLTFDSQAGDGATVYFGVPLGRPEHRDRSVSMRTCRNGASLAGLRILLVEDDPSNSLAAKRWLEKQNYTVSAAQNGLEALEMLRREPYDLVLMDIQMPVMNGLEATRRIRQGEAGRSGVRYPFWPSPPTPWPATGNVFWRGGWTATSPSPSTWPSCNAPWKQ